MENASLIRFVLFNALWILGLAILLATLSYADWLRRSSNRQDRQTARFSEHPPHIRRDVFSRWAVNIRPVNIRPVNIETLNMAPVSMSVYLGFTLFCIGVGLNRIIVDQNTPWWESTIWIALSTLFFIQTIVCGLTRDHQSPDSSTEGIINDEGSRVK